MPAEGRRSLSAHDVAALTRGRLVGPGDAAVARVAPLERAGAGDLSFLASRAYLPYFERARDAVVLCRPEFADLPGGPPTRIVVPDPHAALLDVLPILYPEPAWAPGVHATAVVGRGTTWNDPVALGPHVVLGAEVRLGRNVRIDAGCVLGDGVVVGDDVHLYPSVTCYSGTVIGDRVLVHAGTRLGSDGFGYVPGRAGSLPRKIPQVGRCLIGDDVEIGANTTVDRGSVDDTVIGRGTKIDNLVQVAHNVRIGERCLIAAMVGIAGSTRVGDDVFLAGQVGLADHISVGSGVRITVQSGVIGDIPDGATVTGYPARNHRDYLRAQAALYRLAPLVNQLEALTRREGEPHR
ncbi:MAG TPA: UDP-3-O-(3-hydroxymyristoyl)glucosamine N-acyltransferase [Gemmatimonadales bacterium]|nr:UDP-3-O-(3-hydroxymyristoyl)glucosamine N-acyltransferase [Gemmatimonadales bacterium]